MQPRRLQEPSNQVPELPGPGGKITKVWVGPERKIKYTFNPILSRATHAELSVMVVLGAWRRRCQISLAEGDKTLADIRKIVTAYCFGRDLSEARFTQNSGKPIEIDDEKNIKAILFRPNVGLVGINHRGGMTKKCDVCLSFSAEDTRKVIRARPRCFYCSKLWGITSCA